MDREVFSAKIRAARRRIGMSSDRLSELCDCSPVSIRQIESGARLPSLPKLINLCNALQITPDEVLSSELLFTESAKKSESEKKIQHVILRFESLPKDKQTSVCSIMETVVNCIETL